MLAAVTAAPSPTFKSSLTRSVGGGPTFTGTSGAPAGSGSLTATHGLPAADGRAGAVVSVVDDTSEAFGFTVVVVDELLPPPVKAAAPTMAITRTPSPRAAPSRLRFLRRRAASMAAALARLLTH